MYRINSSDEGASLIYRLQVPVSNVSVKVLFRKGERPSNEKYDDYTLFTNHSENYIALSTQNNVSSYFIGIKLANNSGEYTQHNSFMMEMEIFATGCKFWDEQLESWDNDGCRVRISF